MLIADLPNIPLVKIRDVVLVPGISSEDQLVPSDTDKTKPVSVDAHHS